MADSTAQFDAIVIGAGVMGSSTAYNLAKRGFKLLLLEQFDFLHHRGSSHGESRTIRASYPEDYYFSMVMESYNLWKDLESEIGYKLYFATDHLDIGLSNDKSLAAVISTSRKHSIPHQILNRRQVSEKFSGKVEIPEDWIAIWSKYGGVIKPTKAVSMFQTLAYKNGAILKDNTEVIGIDAAINGGVVVSTANQEKFRGKKCVITVGAWAKKLVKSISGIELPIQAVETTVSYWRIKEGHEEEYAIGGDFPSFASYGNPYIYGTPSFEYPGLVKVALHGGHGCDPGKRVWGEVKGLDLLKEWIEKRFAGRVEARGAVATQHCMYSVTPDEDFVMDFLGGQFGKDVVIAGGFSGHGFKMAPAVGRILADLVMKGEAEGVDLKYFRIARFEGNVKGNVKNFADQVYLH